MGLSLKDAEGFNARERTLASLLAISYEGQPGVVANKYDLEAARRLLKNPALYKLAGIAGENEGMVE